MELTKNHIKFIKKYIEIIKNTGIYPNRESLKKAGYNRDKVRYYFSNLSFLKQAAQTWAETNDPDAFNAIQNAKISTKKSYENHVKFIKKYIEIVKKTGMYPGRAELGKAGYDRNKIRHYFSNLSLLKQAAQAWASENDPTAFDNIIDASIFTKKNYEILKKNVKKHKRFVITTAVVGGKVHEGFLDSIQNYCKAKDAMLLVLPAADPASAGDWNLDSDLGVESIVFGDLALNSNLFLCSIKMSAKQIDPTTGLDRIGQRHGTFIYASPKQRLKFMPVSNVKHPHAEMTTGAITLPNYFSIDITEKYMSERTAYIANHDHVIGALIVEIEDKDKYHFRQIQADDKGGFVDLGDYYCGETVTKMYAEGFSMGDWHSGETDPTAVKAWKEIIELVRPKKLFVHDGFNGLSINHHERERQIRRAILAKKGLLNLESELKGFAKDLDDMATWNPIEEIIVVKSNHDIFLDRWLEKGEYVDDPHNYDIGVTLAKAMVDGHNPLKYAVELLGLTAKDKVRWLNMDEDYFIARIQCGAHGHKGPKGARGSLAGMEKAYGLSVSGHSHAPEILRGAWQNGTSSYLKLSYNEGPSDWVHNSTIIYPNGMRQQINSFEGNWRLK